MIILLIMVKTALSFTSPLMAMLLFSEEEDFLEGCMWNFGGVILIHKTTQAGL